MDGWSFHCFMLHRQQPYGHDLSHGVVYHRHNFRTATSRLRSCPSYLQPETGRNDCRPSMVQNCAYRANQKSVCVFQPGAMHAVHLCMWNSRRGCFEGLREALASAPQVRVACGTIAYATRCNAVHAHFVEVRVHVFDEGPAALRTVFLVQTGTLHDLHHATKPAFTVVCGRRLSDSGDVFARWCV